MKVTFWLMQVPLGLGKVASFSPISACRRQSHSATPPKACFVGSRGMQYQQRLNASAHRRLYVDETRRISLDISSRLGSGPSELVMQRNTANTHSIGGYARIGATAVRPPTF
ncbi:hypothetical protein N656DRAFT_773642 [Canariomyces notabilis]|uniref:Secreted protein n=1 Tax=Canariomyces notabilis TaxID=2074819 RepID=A0AAN6TN58_9PEZI|nr:hypothetical protein N656DRAFT_773642 [Canariomyces arenarius]